MQKTLEMKQLTKTKIGIDFHGVINVKPDFFRLFLLEALKNNLEVYIISGGPRETILSYLNQYQIPYTKLWCIYDYYENRHQIAFFDDGSFKVDDNLWNKAKAEYCQRENICVHIDDSPVYGKKFVTPYCLYDEKNNCCYIDKNKIQLNQPHQALQQILAFCKHLY